MNEWKRGKKCINDRQDVMKKHENKGKKLITNTKNKTLGKEKGKKISSSDKCDL